MLQPPSMGRDAARARQADLQRQAARHNLARQARGPRRNWLVMAWHWLRQPAPERTVIEVVRESREQPEEV